MIGSTAQLVNAQNHTPGWVTLVSTCARSTRWRNWWRVDATLLTTSADRGTHRNCICTSRPWATGSSGSLALMTQPTRVEILRWESKTRRPSKTKWPSRSIGYCVRAQIKKRMVLIWRTIAPRLRRKKSCHYKPSKCSRLIRPRMRARSWSTPGKAAWYPPTKEHCFQSSMTN